MDEIRHLSLADVLALHAAVMERFGLAPAPLRDEGVLESAVMRPRMAAYYDEADLIRQAALLAVGISQAQAFLDGNKRTALDAGCVMKSPRRRIVKNCERSLLPDLDTNTFQEAAAQFCPVFDGFVIWTM